MPLYSAFTRYGMLAYSGAPSEAEKIYKSLVASFVDPRTGDAVIDTTPGTYHESKLYARAMAVASARATVQRAANQRNPLTATESMPHFERAYRLAPGPLDLIETRRAEAAHRLLAPRGNRWEAMTDELDRILGDSLLAVRPVRYVEATVWPTSPADGPGVFVLPEQPAKLIRLLEPITAPGVPSTVSYENWDTSQVAIAVAAGDSLSVQPENQALAEKVTVTAVAGTGASRTLTAVFENAHDQNAAATTGPAPIWWSTVGHLFIVVEHAAALDSALVARVDELLTRIAKAGTTWSIVEPSSPSAETIGPFALGSSPLGLVPVGVLAIEPEDLVVTALSPDTGPSAGGTLVSAAGSGFLQLTDISVNGFTVSTPWTVVDDNTVTFTTDAAGGPGDVIVEFTTIGESAVASFEFT